MDAMTLSQMSPSAVKLHQLMQIEPSATIYRLCALMKVSERHVYRLKAELRGIGLVEDKPAPLPAMSLTLEMERLVSRLLEIGVWPRRAALDLLREYPHDLIDSGINYVLRRSDVIKKPGYLIVWLRSQCREVQATPVEVRRDEQLTEPEPLVEQLSWLDEEMIEDAPEEPTQLLN